MGWARCVCELYLCCVASLFRCLLLRSVANLQDRLSLLPVSISVDRGSVPGVACTLYQLHASVERLYCIPLHNRTALLYTPPQSHGSIVYPSTIARLYCIPLHNRTALLYTPPQSHGSIVRIPCGRSRYIREEKQEGCVWKGHGSRKRTGFTFARSAWGLSGTQNVTYIPTYPHT